MTKTITLLVSIYLLFFTEYLNTTTLNAYVLRGILVLVGMVLSLFAQPLLPSRLPTLYLALTNVCFKATCFRRMRTVVGQSRARMM